MPVIAPERAPTVYARVIGGRRQVWCPKCGTFIDQRTTKPDPLTVIRCKHCDSTYYVGLILYQPAGHTGAPCDVIAPLFAELHPDRIRKGQPVNRLRQLNDDGSWTEIIPAPKVPKP